MSMIALIQWAEKLRPGECVELERGVVFKACESNLTSLLFDHVRESDIQEMVEHINANWDGITLREVFGKGSFAMCRATN